MRSAICIFILSAAALAQTAAQPAPDPTLIAAEKSFVAAAKKGDAAFFKQTLAPDFSFVSFDGEIGDRQDMIDFMSSGGIDLLPYDMKVVSVADGVAIVTYDVVFRVPPSQDEGPPPRYQHFSTVWVKQSDAKQGDVWKMKFQQMTASHFGDW
jgi:hypothetical protein